MQYLIIIVEDFKTLFCCSKFPWTCEIISWNSIGNLGTRPQKGSPVPPWTVLYTHSFLRLGVTKQIQNVFAVADLFSINLYTNLESYRYISSVILKYM
jgi:hypothetical protein